MTFAEAKEQIEGYTPKTRDELFLLFKSWSDAGFSEEELNELYDLLPTEKLLCLV